MKAPLRLQLPARKSCSTPRIDAAELGEGVAFHERQRLGLGDQPVIDLRSTLEWDVGLRIFYWDLPSAIAGMYAHTADLGCCILVNRQASAGTRRARLDFARVRAISSWIATGPASTTSPSLVESHPTSGSPSRSP